MTTDANNQVDALKALAIHFLARQFARPSRRRERTSPPAIDLLVGDVPDTFPPDVPLYVDGTVRGTVVAGNHLAVLVESDHAPQDVISWYRDRFQDAGWIEPEPLPLHPHGGFAPVPPGIEDANRRTITFCRTKNGPSAHIAAEGRDGQPTSVEIRVNLSTDPRESPCTAAERMRRRTQRGPDFGGSVLPPLLPPPGSSLEGRGGGGGDGKWHQSAALETDLDLAMVAAHYDDELARGGWQRRAGHVIEQVAWSRWTFDPSEGDNGKGYLFIFSDESEPGHFDLEIRASWEQENFGDWTSF